MCTELVEGITAVFVWDIDISQVHLQNRDMGIKLDQDHSEISVCSHILQCKGAQIPGARSPGHLNFVRRCLIFVSPQYGCCFMCPSVT
jgi:hypothetical protein